MTLAPPLLVQHRESRISARLNRFSVNDHDGQETAALGRAVVVSHGVMTPGKLHERLLRSVYLGRVSVHSAEHLTLLNESDDLCASVSVGRRPTTGWEFELQADNRFAGAVGELVVEGDLDDLAGAGSVMG